MLGLLLSNHPPQIVVSLLDIRLHILVVFNPCLVLQFVLMHILFLLSQLFNLIIDKLDLVFQILQPEPVSITKLFALLRLIFIIEDEAFDRLKSLFLSV